MNNMEATTIIKEKVEAYTRACVTCSGKSKYDAKGCEDCSAFAARTTFKVTRALHLPRAPLYVPGEKAPKGKCIAQGPIAKRTAELKKRYPSLSSIDAARIELNKMLAAQREPLAA